LQLEKAGGAEVVPGLDNERALSVVPETKSTRGGYRIVGLGVGRSRGKDAGETSQILGRFGLTPRRGTGSGGGGDKSEQNQGGPNIARRRVFLTEH